MLEIARCNHHGVDILICQHLLRVLVLLRLEVECLPYLCGPLLPSQAPQIAYSPNFHRSLRGSELGHVHATGASLSATELPENHSTIRSQDARIRAGRAAFHNRRC